MSTLVEFTQFLLPDGRRIPAYFSLPDHVADKAERIKKAGYTLECEVLTNGMVSFTVTSSERDEAIEICENGPVVPTVVQKLIMEFPDYLIESGPVGDEDEDDSPF